MEFAARSGLGASVVTSKQRGSKREKRRLRQEVEEEDRV
jgi:hypothetical protein